MLPLPFSSSSRTKRPRRSLGAGNAGIDGAREEADVVGVPLALKRAIARLVRYCDQNDHGEQDERGDKRACRCSAPSPVELEILPTGRHGIQSKPVCEADGSPVRRLNAAGRSARRSEHAEYLGDLVAAVLRAERAAEQGHAGWRCRRTGEIDV